MAPIQSNSIAHMVHTAKKVSSFQAAYENARSHSGDVIQKKKILFWALEKIKLSRFKNI